MHNLQEDNLQHLSFFAEYGVLAIDAYHTSPFQVGNFFWEIGRLIRKISGFLAINISCT
jgi:hypothetical protein